MPHDLMSTTADPNAPVACTLSARALEARRSLLATLAADALVSRTPLPGGERLTFTATGAVERDLRAAVAAEASCCAFLTMALRRDDGALVLDVTGPEAARPVIADLFGCRSAG